MKKVDRHENPPYATDHLYLAAFLVCAGHRVVGTTRDGVRIAFLFDNSPELVAAVASFMAGGSVAARQFAFEILKLKKLLPHPTHDARGQQLQRVTRINVSGEK